MEKTLRDYWIEMSIREISTQAKFAGLAFQNLDPKAIQGPDAVFSSIHSFLSHCTMISKMLKACEVVPDTNNIEQILGIDEHSVIHNRVFRNHLEHYDDRLRRWIGRFAEGTNVGTYNIGPKNAIQVSNFIFVSHYDPTAYTFTFIDEDFDLMALSIEASRIKAAADQWVTSLQSGTLALPFG